MESDALYPVKLHEVWVQAGLGPVQSKLRITGFKKTFNRICKCNFTHGISIYKGRPIYPREIPWHI